MGESRCPPTGGSATSPPEGSRPARQSTAARSQGRRSPQKTPRRTLATPRMLGRRSPRSQLYPPAPRWLGAGHHLPEIPSPAPEPVATNASRPHPLSAYRSPPSASARLLCWTLSYGSYLLIRRVGISRLAERQVTRLVTLAQRPDQPEVGKTLGAVPEVPVRRASPYSGAHFGGAALENRRRFPLHRHWGGDLPHLVAVVGRAVQEAHKQRRTGHLGKGHGPR